MSKQQYMWMLGLMVAWRQQFDDDQDKPTSWAMDTVTGVVGSFRRYDRQAANEFAAILFILLLVWLLIHANNRAKSVIREPENRKLTGREILPLSTTNGAPALDYEAAAWIFALVPFCAPPHRQGPNSELATR